MHLPPRLRQGGRRLTVLVLSLGSALITASSAVYLSDDELPPFVIEKLPLPLEALWFHALRIHVVAAAFSLPACLLLVSTTLMRRAPRVHRWLGRATFLAVLLALAPSGFYLALFAKGGLAGTLGFLLSGIIVVAAMVQAVRTARSGQYAQHRRYAWHVLAQLSVAVSSRAMLVALDALNLEPELAYLVSLWLPVLGSAALVELLVPRSSPITLPRRNHETLIRPHRPHPDPAGLRDASV